MALDVLVRAHLNAAGVELLHALLGVAHARPRGRRDPRRIDVHASDAARFDHHAHAGRRVAPRRVVAAGGVYARRR